MSTAPPKPAPALKPERSGPILHALQHAGTVAAVAGLLLTAAAAYVAYETLLREKQAFTMERILLDWNQQVSSKKDLIEKHFPGLYNEESTGQFDSAHAKQLYLLDNNGESYPVRQAMVDLLNYFEIVSIAYDSKIVDQEMFRSFAQGPMLRWRRVLAPFLRIYNEDRETCVWEPYERLMDTWAHTKIPKPKVIPAPCDGAPPKR